MIGADLMQMIQSWSKQKILVWSEDLTSSRRLYKAFVELLPELNVSWCPLSLEKALIEFQKEMPKVVFYVVNEQDKTVVTNTKLAITEACSAIQNQLVATVAVSRELKTTPIDPILEDLCDKESLVTYLSTL